MGQLTIWFEFSPWGLVHRFAQLFQNRSTLAHTLSCTTYICIVRFRKNTKHITIQWTIVLVQRRFTPTSGVETPLSTLANVNFGTKNMAKYVPFGDRSVQTGYP